MGRLDVQCGHSSVSGLHRHFIRPPEQSEAIGGGDGLLAASLSSHSVVICSTDALCSYLMVDQRSSTSQSEFTLFL